HACTLCLATPRAATPPPSPRLRHPHPPLFPYTTLFRSPLGLGSIDDENDSVYGSGHDRGIGDGKDGRRVDQHQVGLTTEMDHKQIGRHTSELQSPCNLVGRLLLEKKKELASRSWAGPTH